MCRRRSEATAILRMPCTPQGCTSLKAVTIPASVVTLGAYAFHGCSALTSATVSPHTSVGEDAFPAHVQVQLRDVRTGPLAAEGRQLFRDGTRDVAI